MLETKSKTSPRLKKGEEQGFTLVRRDPKANVECACMVVKPT
jgi:hypothetical protein